MSTLNTQHAETEHPPITTNAASGKDRIRRQRRLRRPIRSSMAGCSREITTDGSFKFSDTSEDEYHSWPSSMGSTTAAGGGGAGDGVDDNDSLHGCTLHSGASGFHAGPCKPGRRGSCGEDGVGDSCSLDGCTLHGSASGFHVGPSKPVRRGSWGIDDEDEVDLESGELEMSKLNNSNEEEDVEKDCRICHLSLMGNGIGNDLNGNGGIGIELGCACKGDLGNAHKQCAETWFKIKGNITCEICGAIAINVVGEKLPDPSSATDAAPPTNVVFPERQNYCHGRRIMNFLLACMIFAFVISWLFHFNVLS